MDHSKKKYFKIFSLFHIDISHNEFPSYGRTDDLMCEYSHFTQCFKKEFQY
jgi:hypothetical protein